MAEERVDIDRAVREACLPFAQYAKGDGVLIAVSGGADSVALLHLLNRGLPALGLHLHVAHLDHGLRPCSAEDRSFVEKLGDRLGVAVTSVSTDVEALAGERQLGLEEAGRHARMTFFSTLLDSLPARVVAVGHTLDDRAETLLHHLVRGAGTAGLSGMRQSQGNVIRPLLGMRRSALRGILNALGESHREDPSNLENRFSRNYLRNEVLPMLERLNPEVVPTLARTAAILEDEDRALDALTPRLEMPFDALELSQLSEACRRRAALHALRAACGFHHDIGHEHVDALLALALRRPGAHATDLPGGLRLCRRGDQISAIRPGEPDTRTG